MVGGDLEAMLRQKKTIFMFKLKEVKKTNRTFSYDLNQIPYDYIVEMKNRFKGLGLRARRTMDGGRWSPKPSSRKTNVTVQSGCLRRPYKQLRK